MQVAFQQRLANTNEDVAAAAAACCRRKREKHISFLYIPRRIVRGKSEAQSSYSSALLVLGKKISRLSLSLSLWIGRESKASLCSALHVAI